MLYHIEKPNGQPLEIEIDPKQTGKVILDKALEQLDVLEADFFGLQYHGSKGEELWLNLRNKICDQLQDTRLNLRVKFFVMPHFIPLPTTQELFYIQVKEALSKQLISLSDPQCDETTLARIVAHIVQAEHGDQTSNSYQRTVYLDTLREIHPHHQLSTTIIDTIHNVHSSLRGKTHASARYFMLKDVSSLPGYGVEHHKAISAEGHDINFGVGPEGIILHDHKTQTDRIIPYVQIKLATHCEKTVHIQLFDDHGNVTDESFKLVSRKAAVALYRCITEMHSFYRCDTVCSDVQSQYSRDFKGTFVSIFNENSALGKRYIFDIQRTRQEAYDHVKRKLYAKSASQSSSPVHSLHNLNNNPSLSEGQEAGGDDGKNDNEAAGGNANLDANKKMETEINQLKRRLEYYEDSWLCCICKDQRVCIVLIPCGHMTCEVCSKLISQCPQCREDITRCQRVYQGPVLNKIWKEDEKDCDNNNTSNSN